MVLGFELGLLLIFLGLLVLLVLVLVVVLLESVFVVSLLRLGEAVVLGVLALLV